MRHIFAGFQRAIARASGGLASIGVVLALGVSAAVAQSAHPGAPATSLPAIAASYTADQAAAGHALFEQTCVACHGAKLDGAGGAVALKGAGFVRKWGGRNADLLFADVRRMPPGGPPLTPAQSAQILAYVLQANGVAAGSVPTPADPAQLARQPLFAAAGGGRSAVTLVGPPAGHSRLDGLRPVTRAALETPGSEDWLSWRRTNDAAGFSPLAQVDRANVGKLQVAWSWSLPQGGNMMAPIVHDGVLYAYSFGDVVEALDAVDGDLLWRYQRPLAGVTPQGKKGVALAGGRVLVPTSDMHVVALDAKTGAVAWDHAIDVGAETKFQIKSAPLVAGDKVIIGVNGFAEVKGGNFIVALDLATGREVWRFHTVARPGEPGGDSWNGLPLEARSGGSVWVGGSYDPTLNLVYFGTGQTYDPVPLRHRPDRPAANNDALYTDSTLALDADTGRLAWYFQHQPDDQIDHDWSFERLLVPLTVDGRLRKAVVTGGKDAIFDALDATDGHYLFSMDLDMQNVVAAIDPSTGAKRLSPAAIPVGDRIPARFTPDGVCPDLLGARNLMATAYSPRTRLMYVPLTDTCRHPFPLGARWQKHPDPATDGTYGVLKAVDLQDRKVAWTTRTRAPFVSGALATGGDLIFAGTVDRRLQAFDGRTGKVLWSAGLDNAPASYPITYSVDGRQYVAVATNEGFVHVTAMAQVAGVRMPANGGATLWVFALPSPTSTRER